MASLEVDLSGIEEGQTVTVKWRGKPVFIRHRTEAEISEAEGTDTAGFRDPQSDAERVIDPKVNCSSLGKKGMGRLRRVLGGVTCS
jgi:ubiquinol-cytochrome c reductase iron-sulfur subunit